MFEPIKAVIFDMDGVLVDSEPLWRKAMVAGFNEAGIPFTEEDCRKTTGMRFKEVVEIWIKHYNITAISPVQLENKVMDILIELIGAEGKAMPGITEALNYAHLMGYKTGLATSSSNRLLNAVLDKLNIRQLFSSIVSAEFMPYGKPHPEVFLVCAQGLNVHPSQCLVVEDSVNGVIAAKAALMKVIAVPDEEHKNLKQFAVADYRCENTAGVLKLFKELL